jgi:predicted permease
MMSAFLQDLRYALRALAKSPGFTAAAIVILALGIGANTAIFSLVDAVVLHPLPGVSRPEALVDLAGQTASYPWYRSVREGTKGSFAGLAAWRQREMSLAEGAAPSRIRGVVVSGNYFDVIGVRAASGRLFTPADERSGEALVVLGSGLWKSRFGSDPAIAGKVIQLNGSPFTVIGVAPPGFRGTAFGVAPDLWVPIGAWPKLATGEFRTLDLERRGWGWLTVFGRLKPGVSISRAQASLDVAARQEAAAYPDDAAADAKATLQPTLRNAAGFGESGNPVGFLAMLVGAVGAALAIACANLANLLLARAAARGKEIAVRQALGASRSRLVRQLLTESVALGVLGGVAGLLVASWSLGLIVKMPLPGDFSLAVFAPALDLRALVFSLLLSVATGLMFGLLPALQSSRRSVWTSIKSGPSDPARSAARGALLVAQVSLCLLLLVGAGLLGRSLRRALATDVGFQPRGLTLASVDLGLQRYDGPRSAAFLRDLRQRVTAAPGVRSASWTGLVPLGGGDWVETFSIDGFVPPPGGKPPEAGVNLVAADFYRTMGIPLAAGREFDDRLDREDSAPVALVNEAMAKRYWPGGAAVGRRITIGGAERTIVGVSRNFRTGSLRDAPSPEVYVPLAQGGPNAGLRSMNLVVRGEDPRRDVGSLIRAEIRKLDPALPVADIHPYESELAGQLVPQRLGSALLGLFGLLSLALAAVGIYAVISYSVARRTREIGIRMALGARAADVRALVVFQSARPVALGLGLGLALGVAAAQMLRGFLFGVSPADPATFLGVTALLVLCALLAAWLPARRAARIDPMAALRSE